ncbi:hypothetical protein DCAR_0418189 [Daucus carota subsp. sativus]|uniref:Uncharacterized protein n=1 Tax=Daucus carota subsp. sativus TaxID=79200 RepID=A0A165Z807_DAUCS|nr:hypothetical protein DCAR_0418189 [Daucus carota subsp. sativus]
MASLNHRGLFLFCLVMLLVSAMSMRKIDARDDAINLNTHGKQYEIEHDEDDNRGTTGRSGQEKDRAGGDVRVVGH